MVNAKSPYYVLGMDPGIASCGFSLIDLNNNEILEMGTHLFDAPQESKTRVSLAVGRREARSTRRNNKRTKDRQKHCIKLLKEYKLLNSDDTAQCLQSKQGDRPLLELRAYGLDNKFSEREFAQVLYSLSGHRGYIPHGEASNNKEDESKKVLSAISQNEKEMEAKGYRTIGEYLFNLGTSRNKDGNYDLCVSNQQINDEIHALFSSQRQFNNEYASEKLEEAYLKNLNWEKIDPYYDQRIYEMVGNCSYFKEEKRAASADLSVQLCSALERLGHLVIFSQACEDRKLTKSEINTLIDDIFNKQKNVTYKYIRKQFDIDALDKFRGIDDDEEGQNVYEPKAWNFLQKTISPELKSKLLNDIELADDVFEALTFASSYTSLEERLAKLNLTDSERKELFRQSYASKNYKGYSSRSRKALYMLLDAFDDDSVITLTDAERASGLLDYRLSKSGSTGSSDNMLISYSLYDSTCNNPVVLRAMSRMRHIVNSIIKIYGVPHEIHIEVGNELKHSKKEKISINKKIKENKKNNEDWRVDIAGIKSCDVADVTRKELLKYALWTQQLAQDIYSGESINLERLFLEDDYCEIDHILPYSRTADDSNNNKVLTLAKNNRVKGNQTPFEWMSNSNEKEHPSWNDFRARVLNNTKLPARKKFAYLLNDNLDDETALGFIQRNLNDTRYMSRAVKDYLEQSLEFPDNGKKIHVIAVSGGATATLRHFWGLNSKGGTKDRADDRHHAVDACVIAACSQAAIQNIAIASSRDSKGKKKIHESRLPGTQPWDTFADDVIERKEKVIPTRMVSNGVTGRVFEETNYRFDGYTDDNKKLALLYSDGKEKKVGNTFFDGKGVVHIVDGMAFLQLWLDKDAAKGKGKWYADPVYYADIPDYISGKYIPKMGKAHVARTSWEPIPAHVLESSPIRLFRGDVFEVDGKLTRFWSINISTIGLKCKTLKCGCDDEELTVTLGKWNKDTVVKTIEEDCLGKCYEGFDKSSFLK